MRPVFPLSTSWVPIMQYLLAIATCFCVPNILCSQDIHLSHIHASPVHLNPAMSGIFRGDVRLIANYKSQWNAFTKGYRSFMTSADLKANRALGLRDDMSFGIQMVGDKAGDLDFSLMSGNFTFSYLKALNKDGSHILSIGLSGGFNQNRIDISNARLKEQIDPYLINPDFSNSRSYFDLSAGVAWFIPLTVDDFVYLGAARFHINRSQVSFLRRESEVPDSYLIFPRTTLHGGASIRMGRLLTIKPSFIYLHQGPHEEINLGSFFSLNHAERSYLKPEYSLHLGAWIRWSYRDGALNRDALVASIRYDNKDTIYTFSYDINVSDLVKASRSQGGPELSIIHYIDIIRPERKQFRLKCPEF